MPLLIENQKSKDFEMCLAIDFGCVLQRFILENLYQKWRLKKAA